MFREENHPWFLKVSSPIHPFPFVDSVLELSVSLCSDSGKVVVGRNVPLHLTMHYSDDPDSTARCFEVLNPSALQVCSKTGRSPIIRVRLLSSSSHDRRVILGIHSQTSVHSMSIAPFVSPSMLLVRHRIEIVNELEVPTLWFKDEGGKGNQITLQVMQVGARGEPIINQSGLRLKCILCYEDDEEVSNQNILKISNDTSMFIGRDGRATVRCQIREISQNHDCKKFKIRVAADPLHTSPLYSNGGGGISYDYSPAILVKSKISKKNRERRSLKRLREESSGEFSYYPGAPAEKERHVCTISPSNLPGDGGDHGAADVRALQLFSEFTVQVLRGLRGDPDEAKRAIDAVLSQHDALGLGSGATSQGVWPLVSSWRCNPSGVGLSLGDNPFDCGPVSPPVSASVTSGEGIKVIAPCGPEPVRENSLFLHVAKRASGSVLTHCDTAEGVESDDTDSDSDVASDVLGMMRGNSLFLPPEAMRAGL